MGLGATRAARFCARARDFTFLANPARQKAYVEGDNFSHGKFIDGNDASLKSASIIVGSIPSLFMEVVALSKERVTAR